MGLSTGWAGGVQHSLGPYESSKVGQGKSLLMLGGGGSQLRRRGEEMDWLFQMD